MTTSPWTQETITQLYDVPFIELVSRAQALHQENFSDNDIELCTLLSVKTGACPEDCKYCSQSGHYKTNIDTEKLLPLETVIHKAKAAKANGAKRFCMGAAWKKPPVKDLPKVIKYIKEIKKLGLQSCVTLGSLDAEQVQQLKEAGLDYYNHNLDTSPRYYKEIITTRTYEERLQTIELVGDAGINVCCGGILGMGEDKVDRIDLLFELSKLKHMPTSIPINRLVPIPGTPLANAKPIDNIEFTRIVAVARIMFPKARIRLAAGRESMSEEMQALCFLAGANSIFYGEVLLTEKNRATHSDSAFLNKLGITSESQAA